MFDDHAVFPCDDDMICVPEGYLLFYRRVKDHKKYNENLKKNSIYFDYYKNKDKIGAENDNNDEKKDDKENQLKEDIKEIEEDSEGEENEDDEQ